MKNSTLRACLLLFFLSIIIYFPSLNNKFVLDDPSQIINNPAVHSISNIPKLFLGSTFAGGGGLEGVYYKPVMTTFYTVIYSLFGANPLPFHLIQIILHTLNAFLVFLFLKHFFKLSLSLFLSLIFLVHPINTEAVVYISNLQDTLFFFFGMLALLQLSKDKLRFKNYLLYTLFALLSLLSKETGTLFVLISMVFAATRFKKPVGFIMLNVCLITFYGLVRYAAVGIPNSSDTPFPIMRLPFWERVLNIPSIIFHYLKTYFYPKDLAVGQMWVIKGINFKDFYLPLVANFLVLSGLILLGLRLKNSPQFKTFLFFTTWFILGLGLHLQIIPLDATIADRWMYFPGVGILGIIGIIFSVIASPRGAWQSQIRLLRRGLLAMTIIILILLSIRSYTRTLDWKDGLTLALHDTKTNTDSFVMENNLGFEYIEVGNYEEALPHIEKSTFLAPYWWLNWNNLGVIYRHFGDTQKAEQAFKKSAENTNNFYLPYQNLAELYLHFKDPRDAETFIAQTSEKLTLNDSLWFLFSITEYKLGNLENALKAAQQAQFLNPNNQTYAQLVTALQNNQKILIQKPEF